MVEVSGRSIEQQCQNGITGADQIKIESKVALFLRYSKIRFWESPNQKMVRKQLQKVRGAVFIYF